MQKDFKTWNFVTGDLKPCHGVQLEIGLKRVMTNQSQLSKYIAGTIEEGFQYSRTDWQHIMEVASILPKY